MKRALCLRFAAVSRSSPYKHKKLPAVLAGSAALFLFLETGMNYREIDLSTYVRAEHFHYFRTLAYPYMGVTVDVDVTDFAAWCKQNGHSFYLGFMHLAALAADTVEQFRHRIYKDGIIEIESSTTSHVELLENGTYCYCELQHAEYAAWERYFPYAEAQQAACHDGSAPATLQVDEMESLRSIFISCLPWLHYSALIQPAACGDESNPRITWGRFAKNSEGRLMMPLTVLLHHALADGLHMAQFYAEVERRLQEFSYGG